MPMPMRLVAAAQAAAAGSTPRPNGFSASQMEANPLASAHSASATERRASIPPCRRTLSFAAVGISDARLHPARARCGACRREMRVHHVPLAVFLAEHHGRAGDEFLAVVVDALRRRLLAGPVAPGAAMAPDHGHVAGDDAAEVERRPVARLHVLSVELPEPEPVVASPVGVTVEIEEHRLGRLAPDRIELFPIEAGIGVDVIVVQLEQLLAIALRTAHEIGFGHSFPAPAWSLHNLRLYMRCNARTHPRFCRTNPKFHSESDL